MDCMNDFKIHENSNYFFNIKSKKKYKKDYHQWRYEMED